MNISDPGSQDWKALQAEPGESHKENTCFKDLGGCVRRETDYGLSDANDQLPNHAPHFLPSSSEPKGTSEDKSTGGEEDESCVN